MMGIDLEGFTEAMQHLIQYAVECGIDKERLVEVMSAEITNLHEGKHDRETPQ